MYHLHGYFGFLVIIYFYTAAVFYANTIQVNILLIKYVQNHKQFIVDNF